MTLWLVIALRASTAGAEQPAPEGAADRSSSGGEPAEPGEEPPEYIRPGGNADEWEALGPSAGAPVARAGVEPRGFAARALGVRGRLRQGSGDGRESTAGIMAYERSIGVLSAKFVTARYFDELWLGSDGVDLTFGMSLQGALGVFWPLKEHHGPFVRMELRADLIQEVGWSFAQLRVPGGQVGWTYSSGVTQWELLVHGGASLLGHVDTGFERRDLAGFAYGAALSLAWEDLRLDADLSQISPTDTLQPVSDFSAHLCGFLGKRPERPSQSSRGTKVPVYSGRAANDFRASVCADVSLLSVSFEDLSMRPERFAQQTFVGVSLLFGRFTRLDPAPQL